MPDKSHKFRRARFTLGEVRVYPSRNEIQAHGRSLRLQPKVMDVLCYLAQHHDRVIPNEELIAQVWPGRIVTHGSVQKSINLLRKAWVELVGEQELVTHYSKKGYQLQVTPVMLAPRSNIGVHRLRWMGTLALVLCFGVLAVYLYSARHTLLIPAEHRGAFTAVRAYTSDVGHERAAEPHPDNQHLVYIRERFMDNGQGTESELVIRNNDGEDWVLASSAGSWIDLAWSPDGGQLAAVELMYEAGPMLRPNLYARAPRLYDMHVFSLDLATQKVRETHRLSQWQGRINSITWWDDDVLELVATQGDGALNRRYRYAVQTQRLEVLDPLDFVANPLLSKVHRGLTAVTSLHAGRTRVDFLRHDQSRFASQQLDIVATDLSWIPDGSGVLVHAPGQQTLLRVRRDGQVQPLPLSSLVPHRADTWRSRFRYSGDGQRLYFTEERPQAQLWQQILSDIHKPLIQNSYLNYSARFSPDGERLVYLSVRNNQTQLWVVENEQERQVFRHHSDQPIADVRWASNDKLVYTVGDAVVVNHLHEPRETTVRLSGATELMPIAYRPDTQDLVVLDRTSDAHNLWQLNAATGRERQLTFGAVATAVGDQNAVYFQYVGQRGLWVWRAVTGELHQLTPTFTRDAHLLSLNAHGLFYTVGDRCRESHIYYFRFSDQHSSQLIERDTPQIFTNDFHPNQGAVYTPCYIMEADIMMLE